MSEKRKNQLDEVIQYNLLKSSKRSIKQAQWILFGVSMLGYGSLFYLYMVYIIPTFVIIGGIFISSIYLLLAILSVRKPKVPIIVGMAIYWITIVLITRLDPSTIFDGLIIKVLVLVGLIKGFFAAREAEIQQYKLNVIREKLEKDNKQEE